MSSLFKSICFVLQWHEMNLLGLLLGPSCKLSSITHPRIMIQRTELPQSRLLITPERWNQHQQVLQRKYESRHGWPFAETLCREGACTNSYVTKVLSLKQLAALSVTCWIDACTPLTFLPLHLPTPLLTDTSVYSVSNGPWPHTVKASMHFHAELRTQLSCKCEQKRCIYFGALSK